MNILLSKIDQQRKFFNTHQTLSLNYRRQQLKLLKKQIINYEKEIIKALKTDLNKGDFEAYATEIGMVYQEINYMLKHMDKFSCKRNYISPIMHFLSTSATYQDPYGCVLIMSPWNYPFQLTMMPLIGALAAGNCVLIQPASESYETSIIIKKILNVFDDAYVSVVQGGIEVSSFLLEQRFDYIFFTGSPRVGRIVMEKAARYLTPVTLELGGKSPCIVDDTADIDLAAKRIVWGKMINAGQTCVAPDYLWVDEKIRDELILSIENYKKIFYSQSPETNVEYSKIINQRHYDRLMKLTNHCAKSNENTLQIDLTIIKEVTWESEVMQEEIFGPILPVMCYHQIDEVINTLNVKEKPLSLYLFTNSKQTEQRFMKETFFGGGCINDVIIHVASSLPFGGIGNSGHGSYHGKKSFDTFSHTKSVIKKSNLMDINIRYAPSSKWKLWILKKLLSR